ncbi:MAG: 2,3-diketo-L-gulonate reductase [Saprospiraceae bacterium]|nr:MAG: 2,3-diketo-L-gulonate reductase [Saprospiraceae bacterium]
MIMKIAYTILADTLKDKLINKGFEKSDALECARLFAQATLDGVNSHGVNRFVLFMSNIDKGIIDIQSKPLKIKSFNALEQWDGQLGSGPNNASFAMTRAMTLADQYGISCVALRNTNHWMRGGNYGLLAAEAGYMSICWSNTMPNMPAWGGNMPRIGNNPLIFSMPGNPHPILLDMSMSLFSYGKMESYQRQDKKLPYPGGFNKAGEMTDDPQSIIESMLPISIGYWKGSGLSIMLDLFAAILSEGRSTGEVGQDDEESGLSQVFICLSPDKFLSKGKMHDIVNEILSYTKKSSTIDPDAEVRYPSERSFRIRAKQLEEGIEVHDQVWQEILALG